MFVPLGWWSLSIDLWTLIPKCPHFFCIWNILVFKNGHCHWPHHNHWGSPVFFSGWIKSLLKSVRKKVSGGCKRYSLGALQDWMGTWRTLLWDHVTYLITTKATIGASLWLGGKELTNAGDMGLIPGWGCLGVPSSSTSTPPGGPRFRPTRRPGGQSCRD